MLSEGGELGDQERELVVAPDAAPGVDPDAAEDEVVVGGAGVAAPLVPGDAADVHRLERMDHRVVERRRCLAVLARVGLQSGDGRAGADGVGVGQELDAAHPLETGEVDGVATALDFNGNRRLDKTAHEVVDVADGKDMAAAGRRGEGRRVAARRGPVVGRLQSDAADSLAVEEGLVTVVDRADANGDAAAGELLGERELAPQPRDAGLRDGAQPRERAVLPGGVGAGFRRGPVRERLGGGVGGGKEQLAVHPVGKLLPHCLGALLGGGQRRGRREHPARDVDGLELAAAAGAPEGLLGYPRLDERATPAAVDDADRDVPVERFAESLAEPVADSAERKHGIGGRGGLPFGTAWSLAARGVGIGAERHLVEPEAVVVSGRGESLAVLQAEERILAPHGELHVGLARAEPHVAHEDVSEFHPGGGPVAVVEEGHRVRSAGLGGRELENPLAVGVRNGVGRSAEESARDARARRGETRDADGLAALEDHMVSVGVAEGEGGVHECEK